MSVLTIERLTGTVGAEVVGAVPEQLASDDGLADAVRRLAEASGVGAAIDANAVPVEPDASKWFSGCGNEPLTAAMSGGDDYELLFAVRPRLRGRLAAAMRHGQAPITRIGVCTDDRAVVVQRGSAREPITGGYTHFLARRSPGDAHRRSAIHRDRTTGIGYLREPARPWGRNTRSGVRSV